MAAVATVDVTAGPAPAGKAEGAGKGDATGKAEAQDRRRRAEARKARIVVIGTADFASNQFLGAQGNRDFFLNVVSWLAEEEDLLSVRPREAKAEPIVLTSPQSQLVFWLPLAVLPRRRRDLWHRW